METIYKLLPDFSGILLAAVGVAMFFAPNWIDRVGSKWRWAIATGLLLLGLLGMRSSFTQRGDSDKSQRELGEKVDSLRGQADTLQATVSTYGPKLDALINHPESQDQKALAIALRNEMRPKIQLDEPTIDGVNPSLTLLAVETNVGGSIAKAVSSTANAQIDVRSSEAEAKLFRYLHDHENDADIKPMDVNPGYAARSNVLILSRPPLTPSAIAQMKSDEVVYIGILTVFSDQDGRTYHTEKCMYFDNGKNHLNRYCDGHNITY